MGGSWLSNALDRSRVSVDHVLNILECLDLSS